MSTPQVSMIGNLKAPTVAIFEWLKKPSNLFNSFGVPFLSTTTFLLLWGFIASQIDTSLGKVPGPVKVWEQAITLYQEHVDERNKEAAFYTRQEKRNAEKLQENPQAEVKIRPYTGKPTFLDQIFTSILTVATGFLIASLIAIPIGIICLVLMKQLQACFFRQFDGKNDTAEVHAFYPYRLFPNFQTVTQ